MDTIRCTSRRWYASHSCTISILTSDLTKVNNEAHDKMYMWVSLLLSSCNWESFSDVSLYALFHNQWTGACRRLMRTQIFYKAYVLLYSHYDRTSLQEVLNHEMSTEPCAYCACLLHSCTVIWSFGWPISLEQSCYNLVVELLHGTK